MKCAQKISFNQPVRYVVVTNPHPDDTAKFARFLEDGGLIVVQENAKQLIASEIGSDTKFPRILSYDTKVLPGTAINVPPGTDVIQQIVNPAIAAMTANPNGAFAIASITQTPVDWSDGPELLQSIATALGGAAGYPEILALTHGQAYFDNTATQYTGALPAPLLAFINANVQRFSGTPAGRNSIEHNYTPTGDLRIPALTLSTNRDPVIPTFNRILYGQAVATNGDGDRLVQRFVPGSGGGYGHCTFKPQELTTAFFDLIFWGVKPTP